MNTPHNPNNNPAINPDDPKWTAYVLGEVTEAERLEIEHLLETSEEARALVEDLTLATTTLKEELFPSTTLMMSAEQRAAIRMAAEPKPRRWVEMFPSNWGLGVAAAALIVMAVVVPVAWKNEQRSAASEARPTETVLSTDAAELKQTDKLAAETLENDATKVPSTVPEADQAAKENMAAPKLEKVLEAATPTLAPSFENTAVALSTPAAVSPSSPASVQRAEADSVRQEAPAGAVAAPVMTVQQFAEVAQGRAAASPPAPRVTVTSGSGALSGSVMDPSSALIPGVTVTATNTDTGVSTSTVTNESGSYNFPNLVAGTYRVSATLPGFQTRTVTGVQVGTNLFARLNFPLQLANVNTSVEVTATADSLVAASSASVGEVLTAQQARDLPLVGNNVLDLISILPGQTAAAGIRSGPAAGQQGQQGQQGRGGGGGGRGGAATTPQAKVINPDLVGEVRTTNAPVDAELGRGNGQIQITTRSGSNVFAGGAAAAPPPPPPAAPPARADRPVVPNPNTEAYDRITDNPFIRTAQENLATFSIDVDTASYANVRRFLNQNQLPPRDAVRIEELVNYFSYDYAQPSGNDPIAPNMEVAAAPWSPSNRLVRIGVKAREVNANRRPPSNLVFLIDVSGSMSSPEKLPLLKAGLGMLVERLGENDMVSMVVYAGNSGLVLAPTSGTRKEVIRQAIDRLEAGGSTNGASGIQLAYNQASVNLLRNGVNRVILMTDGDFNVGVTNQSDLIRLIQDRAKTGVFLSVLGFGMGNIKDSTLEKLADEGNGHYSYIDNLAEARKVLVEEMSGTLVTVAKDVKIQVDFNPAKVEAYRLIGYENRILRTEDFNNDAKDAGDMGAGHTVTALFEVVPKGGQVPGPSVDPSKYTQPAAAAAPAGNVGSNSNEMLTLRVRYKEPNADTSKRMDVPLVDRGAGFARATTDFRFAASVAQFGMILRDSPYRGNSRMEFVLDTAQSSRGEDRNGYRSEFITLVQKARNLGR